MRAPFLARASWHMTASEMNARGIKNIGRTGALVAALIVTSACAVPVGPFDTRTDASPLTARVDALVAENRTYPRWEDFPGAPVDPPQPARIAAEVAGLEGTGAALDQQVSALTWDVADAAALGVAIQSRINAGYATPATAQTAAEVEAFARRLRERSEPPPPLN